MQEEVAVRAGGGGTWIEFPVSTRGSASMLSTLQMVECFSLCISSHPLPFQINTLVNFNINLKQATKGFPRLPYTRVPGSECLGLSFKFISNLAF